MSEDFSTEIADGSVLVADTIEELAAKMEVPAANLQAALDTWNADMSAEQKADSQFPTRVRAGDHRHPAVLRDAQLRLQPGRAWWPEDQHEGSGARHRGHAHSSSVRGRAGGRRLHGVVLSGNRHRHTLHARVRAQRGGKRLAGNRGLSPQGPADTAVRPSSRREGRALRLARRVGHYGGVAASFPLSGRARASPVRLLDLASLRLPTGRSALAGNARRVCGRRSSCACAWCCRK